MALTKEIFISMIVTIIGIVVAREIPDFLHICKVGDSKFEQCVVESIEFLKPYLKTGVPEYNLPSLEPLKLNLSMTDPSRVFKIKASNLDIRGASNFFVKKLRIDVDNLHFLVDIALPNIIVKGKYNIDGKILLLPIHGSGPLLGNFSNIMGLCDIHVEKYINENGIEKIRIKSFQLKVSIGTGSLKLDNLFDGEQALGDVINSAINNNFNSFASEILPVVEKALSDAFTRLADSIVNNFSYAQLLPKA